LGGAGRALTHQPPLVRTSDKGISTYKRCLGDHNWYSIGNHRPCKFKIFILVSTRTQRAILGLRGLRDAKRGS
jgi:hypothetical protein